MGDHDEIEDSIHSVVTYDVKDHLILFDDENAYIIKMNPFQLITDKGICCTYCYQSPKGTSTMAFISIDSLKLTEGVHYIDVLASVNSPSIAELKTIYLVDTEIGALPFVA